MTDQTRTPDFWRKFAKRMADILFYVVLVGVLLFVSSGRLDWPLAWAYLGVMLFGLLLNAGVLLRINPAVIAARAEPTRDDDRIHTLIGLVYGLFSMFGAIIVAGLDARLGWTPPYSPWWVGTGLALMLAGNLLLLWSLAVNKHFEKGVRIQTDRAQTVITGGPYQIIRHPGYTGIILSLLATPLALGSLWALIPEVVAIAAIVLRTVREDQMLHRELSGYAAYAQHTRYRLLPGIW